MNNTTPDTVDTDDDERAAVLAGLAELRRQLPLRKLTLKYGARSDKPHIRHQLYLTNHENCAWSMIVAACSIAVGRPVSKVLVMRLALTNLLSICAASLKDPVVREKLRADLIQVRNERAAENV